MRSHQARSRPRFSGNSAWLTSSPAARSAAVLLCVLAAGTAGRLAAAPVDIELVTTPGFPLAGQQSWLEVFRSIPHGALRIRTGRGGERPAVSNRGTAESPRYHVVGILTGRDELELPGARFRRNDRIEIARWFERLEREGIDTPGQPRLAFGLTAEQLVRFHDRLAAPLVENTKGQRVGDVARTLVKRIGLPYEVTSSARNAFARNDHVDNELKGLSVGTALAAVLRASGLAMAPRKRGPRDTVLVIASESELDESWPVGWPPQDSPFRTAPDLFERIEVEIRNTSLAKALEAISQRITVPLVWDESPTAVQEVNWEEVMVSFPRKRASYMQILDKILFEAHCTNELRLDEASHPFLWVTAKRRPPSSSARSGSP